MQRGAEPSRHRGDGNLFPVLVLSRARFFLFYSVYRNRFAQPIHESYGKESITVS